MQIEKMPVSIITGFLGAGKTTLLNHLLQKNKGKRFIILENEYGEESIDGSIIKKNERARLFELANGCICCTLNDDLGTVLNEIIHTWDSFDHLIVEATGIANPADIIKTFVIGDIIPNHFEMDSVICLIDAHWFLPQFEQHKELRKQVAQSDTILINKSDLVTASVIDEITILVQEINPFAKLHLSLYGKTKDVELLNTQAYRAPAIEKSLVDYKNMVPDLFANKGTEHRINSYTFTFTGIVDMNRFSEWMDHFLVNNTGNIFRIKGILNLKDVDYKVILQSVYDHCSFQPGSNWKPTEVRKSTLVFIGTEFCKKELQKALNVLFS